jgi:hypothetical protein
MAGTVMNDREALEFYLQMYNAELDRKNSINANITLPVAVLTVLTGGALYFLKNIPFPPQGPAAVSFLVLGGAGIIALLVAMLLYMRAWWKHEYQYLPRPGAIESFRTKLQDYYESEPNEKPGFATDFSKYLIERVTEATAVNRNSNSRKIRFSYLGAGFTIGAMCLFAASTIPFYMVGGLDEPEQIEVVGSGIRNDGGRDEHDQETYGAGQRDRDGRNGAQAPTDRHRVMRGP